MPAAPDTVRSPVPLATVPSVRVTTVAVAPLTVVVVVPIVALNTTVLPPLT
jgi:hypothetical protein